MKQKLEQQEQRFTIDMAELKNEIGRAFTLRDQSITDLQGRVLKLESENRDLQK
jgi:hypothetical protein